ncbi:Flp pilus assembly protein CpaB [Streptomyces sp. UNOC14_S4]|uniref:Flp pilus assembly protein CpaB n=1 Tax=Streptomyces sp. UNOC14_S4 TaxID=2872340 RepID=UPI001E50925F|nr:Flp pilus assembly protein CpaB [Streptomyces sp. UNOC14_S4]MCC3771576.1 Flp pilus assembly protein CpaB [Streptomyces sp. UNOC14_S4]
MNSRQRRGVILLLLSALCALGVFAGVFSVVHDAESKVGPEATAYRLRADIPAYQPLEQAEDRFEKISMPKRWLPATAVTDLGELTGKIAVTPLRKGSLLQEDMITERPELKPGQQEIAIMIDAATGVAGKINAGSRVNIYATFDGKDQGTKPVSKVIVSNARVLAVGKLKALDRDGGTSTATTTRHAGEAVPITFALDTKDAQRVAYAESFASHVRLALVAPGSNDEIGSGDRTYTLDGDK